MRIFLVFLAALIVLAAAGWNIYDDHQRALIELVDAQRSTDHMKMLLADRRALQETLKRHYDLQRKIYDTNASLTEARAVMNELQGEIDMQKRVYQGMLDTRRSSAQGKVIGMLDLADGRTLRDTKILSFDDSTLTVQTDGGILKLRAQDLPAHLQDYFRFDLIEPETSPLLSDTNPFESNAIAGFGTFKYSADAALPASSGEPDRKNSLALQMATLTKQIQNLEVAKHSPLTGIDARLKVGSAAYKYRKKSRDDKYEREIAILNMRRRSISAEQKELQRVSSR